jgi:hypothetical protein
MPRARRLARRGRQRDDLFAWALVDEPTARWDYDRLGRAGGLVEWRAEHQHLHGFAAMRAALDSRFRERSFEWGPYLSEYERDPLFELLDEGVEWQALGPSELFAWAGTHRGHDGVRGRFGALNETMAYERFELLELYSMATRWSR